jgi:hypothetical protein
MFCAIFRYQNPFFPYTEENFGIDGPYHNFVWDIFGITERFRGPYISPNVLGYNVVFILILSGVYKSKLTAATRLMGLIILLLSGSRISMTAFATYYIISKSFVSAENRSEDDKRNIEVVSSRGNVNKISKRIGLFLVL